MSFFKALSIVEMSISYILSKVFDKFRGIRLMYVKPNANPTLISKPSIQPHPDGTIFHVHRLNLGVVPDSVFRTPFRKPPASSAQNRNKA
jgi:hypothetical protein